MRFPRAIPGNDPRYWWQGELTTREYDRTVKISTGKYESVERTIQQLVVELRADTIRILDRSNGEQSNAAKPPAERYE